MPETTVRDDEINLPCWNCLSVPSTKPLCSSGSSDGLVSRTITTIVKPSGVIHLANPGEGTDASALNRAAGGCRNAIFPSGDTHSAASALSGANRSSAHHNGNNERFIRQAHYP